MAEATRPFYTQSIRRARQSAVKKFEVMRAFVLCSMCLILELKKTGRYLFAEGPAFEKKKKKDEGVGG